LSLSATVHPDSPKTSLLVSVTLESNAIVYCGTFGTGVDVSTANDVMAQRISTTSSASAAQVTIQGLAAATPYQVFCTTQSFEGAILSAEGTLQNTVTVSTDCCQVVTVDITANSIAANSAAIDALRITVDSLPSTDLNVTVAVTSTLLSASAPQFYPSVVTFSRRSLSRTVVVTIAAGNDGGSYTVGTTVTGADSSRYSIVFQSGHNLAVLGKLDVPAVPTLKSATFKSDGSAVIVTFDAATNMAGYSSGFVCSTVLNFVGVAAAACQWTDASTITVYPSNSVPDAQKLVVTSPIQLIAGNGVRAACSYAATTCLSWETAAAVEVLIAAPATRIRPVLSLSLPTTLSGCTAMTLDFSASSGSGGRRWSTPTFSVISGSADVSVMVQYLNGNFSFGRPTIVQGDLFPNSGTYTFTVGLCNFLGACSQVSRSMTVDKDAGSSIVLTIPGQQFRTVTRGSPLLLTALAFTTPGVNCQGDRSSNSLSYKWSVYDNDVLQPLLLSVSQDLTMFRLPAYRLTVQRYYDIRLAVRNLRTGRVVTSAVTVQVLQSELVAQLAGGATQTVPINSAITLDGSTSYDKDVQTLTGVAAGLTYSWSCVQTAPTFSPACPLDLSRDGSIGSLGSGQRVTLFALNKAINSTAIVTMTIVDAGKTRTRSASVTIKALDSSSPLVAITTGTAALSFVNTRNTLLLSGSVSVQSACVAQWSTDAVIAPLSVSSLTPPSVAVPSGTTRVVSLLLIAGVLPARSALKFTLSCGPSSSSVQVTTNGPPLPGTFSVDPLTGTEMTTHFKLAADVWVDPNLPLTYQFGFTSPSSGALMAVQGRSEAALATSTLPAGSVASANSLECVLLVFDALSASSRATSSVTVSAQVNTTALEANMRLKLAYSSGSNDATKGVLAISSAVLNTVSCARAPPCTALNRAACARVENTCGECLAGHVGEAGERNSGCLLESALSTPAGGFGSVGSTCVNNTQCSGWNVCNTTMTEPVCILPSKPCPNKCSGQGQCTYRATSSQETVPDCKMGDPACMAFCSCVAPYTGSDCGLTTAYVQQRQALRAEFLQSLLTVTQTDDVSEDNIESTASSLSALTQNVYELPKDSIDLVQSVAAIVFKNVADLGTVPYSAAEGALDAADAASSAATLLGVESGVADGLLGTVTGFSDLVSAQLVTGQDQVVYMQESFRMVSARQQAESGTPLLLGAPLSALENAAGTVTSFAQVSFTDSEEVAVSLISTDAATYGALGKTFTTNPLRVKVSRPEGSADPVVKFTLIHRAPVEFTNATVSFNTTCTGKQDRSVTYHNCPLSGEVLMHNCTGLAGVMVSYCPVRRPACSVIDTASNTADTNSSLCEVTGSDTYSTNCTCTLRAATSSPDGRRLASTALTNSGVLDVVSSSVYLGNDFADTFTSADDLNSVEDLKAVLIVIVMFASLWAGGLLLILSCTWRRQVMAKVNAEASSKLHAKADKLQVTRSAADVRTYLTDYVVATFPSVFSNKPFFSRVYGEIRRHHKYVLLVSAEEGDAGDKQRILTGAQLLSVQTMLMFSLALLYDVQGPADDGSCVQNYDQASCISRRSPFDESISYCKWSTMDATGDGVGDCSYQEPYFSFQVVVYIAVIVALLIATISYPIDKIFELLSAPVADASKLSQQEETAIASIGRRVSNIARRASNAAANLAVAAKNRLGATGRRIAGTVTRKIPPSTEAAHALATASSSALTDTFRVTLQQRQMSRLRVFHESEARYQVADAEDARSEVDSSTGEDERIGPVHDIRQVADVEVGGQLRPVAVFSTDVDRLLDKLSHDIAYQRKQLQPSELESFDAQWGVDTETGEFKRGADSVGWLTAGRLPGARELISSELAFVKAETALRAEKLSVATDTHTGLEILHLFIQDLLGRNTPAAIIFSTKANEDFEHTTVVSRSTKYLAVAALVLLNVFFVYYAMLTGFRRGLSWQRMYLVACIIQFVVEIFLFETMECVWIHCVIPALVSDEVRTVGDSVVEVVEQLCDGSFPEATKYLNAPDYLFVSTNVAKKFPDLMESLLVQAYSSHVPGELAKVWQAGGTTARSRRRGVRNIALAASVITALQVMGTAPFIVHRMFIRFLQPFVFTGIVLIWNFVVADPIYILVACIVIAMLIAYSVYSYYLDQRTTLPKVASFASVTAAYADAEAQEIDVRSADVTHSEGALNLVLAFDRSAPASARKAGHGKRRSECSDESKDSSADVSSSSGSCAAAAQPVSIRGPTRKGPQQRVTALYASSAEDGAKSDSAGRSEMPGSPRSARAESLSTFSAVPSVELEPTNMQSVALLNTRYSRSRLYSADSDHSTILSAESQLHAPPRQRVDSSELSVRYSLSSESSSGGEWADGNGQSEDSGVQDSEDDDSET
jgi:hypothetical protein